MRTRLRAILPLVAAVTLLSSASPTSAAGAAPVFQPVIPKLARGGVPVYLPSWLPNFGRRVYPIATLFKGKRAYEVDLSYVRGMIAGATTAFYMTANLEPLSIAPHPRHISLGHGVTALLGAIPGTANDSLTIRWRQGGIVYVMGRLGNEPALIRAARSMVQVH